jgi:glucuronate isomerase
MAETLCETLYAELSKITLVDPHTHINPHSPASQTLADLLGYHYYTELAHSAGAPKATIESDELSPRDRVGRLIAWMETLENTVQYSWLVDICQRFFGLQEDRLHLGNWEPIYDNAVTRMSQADWAETVLQESNVSSVFLTNDFDDELTGFDTSRYIPCLRTDDLVFHLTQPLIRQRLAACSGVEVVNLDTLRNALEQRFQHFVSHGAKPAPFPCRPISPLNRLAMAALRRRSKRCLPAGLRPTKPIDAPYNSESSGPSPNSAMPTLSPSI